MNYIKTFKLFESNWSIEEFIQELAYHLGQYNLTAVYIREVISKYNIDYEIESGKSPLELSKKIISDLGLDERGKEGYMKVNVYKPGPDVIKYL
jgi:hypothetical protein